MVVAQHAITLKSNPSGLLRSICTECAIAVPHGADGDVAGDQFKSFIAIWDTGATGSVITQVVVDSLQLKPTGMVQVHGVAGIHMAETYVVNFRLPNGVNFAAVPVTKGMLPGGADGDVLIGMDIITTGDFVITNKGGQTVFSFRVPSMLSIDFVDEINKGRPAGPAWPTKNVMGARQIRRQMERDAKKGR